MKWWIGFTLLFGIGTIANIVVGMMDDRSIDRWHYQLQNFDGFVDRYHHSIGTLFVIDYSKDGTHGRRFSREEIHRLKNRGRNQVVSYMSIGEAEEYRWYFKTLTKEVVAAPNPSWPDNRTVFYWDSRWQEVILGQEGYLSAIVNAGFDGVYLDIVDAYMRFPDRKNAASEMVEFLVKIKDFLNQHGKKIVIAQNAPCILSRKNFEGLSDDQYDGVRKSYFWAVDAIALESTFFMGQQWQDNPYRPNQDTIQCVEDLHGEGVDVLAVDYLVRHQDSISRAHELYVEHDYLGFVTDRDLKGQSIHYPPRAKVILSW